MLHIWVGRAGSGKSRRVLEAMEKNRRLRRQVLLVPEHISHEAEVDLCRALGPTASRDAEVLSFRSLSSRVLAETGGLAEFTLDNGGKLLTMRRGLQELWVAGAFERYVRLEAPGQMPRVYDGTGKELKE